jgi:hypothetical protein
MPDNPEQLPAASAIEDIGPGIVEPPSPEIETRAKQEREFFGTKIRGENQNIEERKKYAHRTFCLICAWLTSVFLLLLLQGFEGFPASRFVLDKTIIITVVGTTTASVLGIFIVVMHYLFPTKGEDDK